MTNRDSTVQQKTQQRRVARIDHPIEQQGMAAAHRVRQLVPPDDSAATDPFLLLMEDTCPEGVFDRHPHRGIETVTYVLKGEVEHYDNHGAQGLAKPGDALWLTAGRGLIHNEIPLHGETIHILQLWINLPAANKMVDARLQVLQASSLPRVTAEGIEIRVFSGPLAGQTGPARNYAPVIMAEVNLATTTAYSIELPADANSFVVILDGTGLIGADTTRVRAGDVVWLTPESKPATSELLLKTEDSSMRLMLFAGHMLNEPVAMGGPFVMNSRAEIQQAYVDFQAQGERFGIDTQADV
ncbi:pirin family protein [Pseudomaricurvus alcaniphilus]|uniref:pirin family protein n=1 Tax=Pseudomaricurvus alcaniphilus TaxID=1166482 RepID=UPI001409A708|nr:pirin family protein [Pseudomaricurvus alcaniphilus]NHN36531.1 pirin family protein [Pseudomaricurvus alcaniphilus]